MLIASSKQESIHKNPPITNVLRLRVLLNLVLYLRRHSVHLLVDLGT